MNFDANDFGATGVAKVIAEFERPLVFGMPGGHTINIYDALHDMQDRVECVLVREESHRHRHGRGLRPHRAHSCRGDGTRRVGARGWRHRCDGGHLRGIAGGDPHRRH